MGHNHGYGHAGGSGAAARLVTKGAVAWVSASLGKSGSNSSSRVGSGGSGGSTTISTSDGGSATIYGGSGGDASNGITHANGGGYPSVSGMTIEYGRSGNSGGSTGWVDDGHKWAAAAGGDSPMAIPISETPLTLISMFIINYFKVARKIVYKYGIYPWEITKAIDSSLYEQWNKTKTLTGYKNSHKSVKLSTCRGYEGSLSEELLGKDCTVGDCPGTVSLITLNSATAKVNGLQIWIKSGSVVRINSNIYRQSIRKFVVSNGTYITPGRGIPVAHKTWCNTGVSAAGSDSGCDGAIHVEVYH